MNRPMPWKKYPMAAGTILPRFVHESDGWFLDAGAEQLNELRVARSRELAPHFDERLLARLHRGRVSSNQGHDDDRPEERAENGARVRTRPPAHLANAEHAEQKRERHEESPNVLGGGVEVGERGHVKIPAEGPSSLR